MKIRYAVLAILVAVLVVGAIQANPFTRRNIRIQNEPGGETLDLYIADGTNSPTIECTAPLKVAGSSLAVYGPLSVISTGPDPSISLGRYAHTNSGWSIWQDTNEAILADALFWEWDPIGTSTGPTTVFGLTESAVLSMTGYFGCASDADLLFLEANKLTINGDLYAQDLYANGGDIKTTSSDLTIAPGGGDTSITGTLSVSSWLRSTGDIYGPAGSGFLRQTTLLSQLATPATKPMYLDVGGAFEIRDVDSSNATRFSVDSSNGNTRIYGTMQVDGNTTLGDASTDTITCTGRMIVRTISSMTMTDINGTVAEIVYNNLDGKFYGCTTTGNPATWSAFN